jgi:biogenesis of lysosome-related organelles complex 1 subunit 1
MYKEHQVKQRELRAETDKQRALAVRQVGVLTNGLMDSVNEGVAHVFANQKRLEEETRKLEAQAERFAKQTQQWVDMTETFYSALKELGDVENWASCIERDMRAITSTLAYLHETQAGNNSNTTSSSGDGVNSSGSSTSGSGAGLDVL